MSRFSQTKFRNCVAHSYGFTLAEILVTLAILGIVAAMTVPMLLRNQTESANRTRLRKAMSVYERAINTIIIENDLRSTDALDNWANNDGNCTNVRAYFKIVEDGDNLCQFKTGDGVWWSFNSTDGASLTKTMAAFKKNDLNVINASSESDNSAFYLTTQFDESGSPRIVDIQYAYKTGSASVILSAVKVYAFINKRPVGDYYILCQDGIYKSCMGNKAENSNNLYIFDEDGKSHYILDNCQKDGSGCEMTRALNVPVGSLDLSVLNPTCCDGTTSGDSCPNTDCTDKNKYAMSEFNMCNRQTGECQIGLSIAYDRNLTKEERNASIPDLNDNIKDLYNIPEDASYTKVLKGYESDCPLYYTDYSQCATNRANLSDGNTGEMTILYRYQYKDSNNNSFQINVRKQPYLDAQGNLSYNYLTKINKWESNEWVTKKEYNCNEDYSSCNE